MNSLELLKVLIDKLERYENSIPDKTNLSLEAYIQSFQSELTPDDYKNSLVGDYQIPERERSLHIENNIERVITQHLLFLNRYIKFYSKTALSDSKIKTLEEFSFLITVMQQQRISKTDIIKRNIFEKSSGIEIINRLIKANMLGQVDNPEDQRSQLIFLTDAGKFELFSVFEKMNTLGKIATGELTSGEKIHLAGILKKLDAFHYDNYTNKELRLLEDYLPDEQN